MKLANEIAREAELRYGYSDDCTGKTGIDIQETELAFLIAVKLKPIKAMLADLVGAIGRLDKVDSGAFADGSQGTILYNVVCALREGCTDWGRITSILNLLSEE